MEQYVIGTDIGTTVAKVILFDKRGTEVDVVTGAIQHYSDQPLYMEMEMEDVYTEVCRLIRILVANNNLLPEQIAGIGLSGQGVGLWPIGYDGKPVGRAMMWCDARGGEIAMRLMGDAEQMMRILDVSGSALSGGSGSMLVRWLIENDPERLEKIRYVGTCFDWLKYRMTGDMTLGESYTADCLDIHTMEYSDELFEIFGIAECKEKWPPLKRTVHNSAPLSAQGAFDLGLREGTPVTAGPFDMPACAVGMGVLHPGTVGIVMGTSNIVCYPITHSREHMPKSLTTTIPHVCDGRWLRLTGTMTCTPNFDWAISRFGPACGVEKGEYDKLEAIMNEVPLGCDGLVYHPYLSTTGERAPFFNPSARGQFSGLSLNHTAAHMLRAVYEGVGYSILDCMLQTMPDYPVKQFRVSGGGSRSPFIMQMLADMTGVETVTTNAREVGAKGSAICASVACGIYDDIFTEVERVVKVEKVYHPDPERTKKYRKMYELFLTIREGAPAHWMKREEVLAEFRAMG